MKKAVIFDLDGTLLNTLSDLAASVNFALSECGYPVRSVDEVRRFIGNGVIMLVHRSVPSGTAEADEKKCFGIFRAHYLEHMEDTTAPYDGVNDLLFELSKRGVKTAVVSNKLDAGVKGLCEKHFPHLTCAFGVNDESERKPSPKNVFKALLELGIEKEDALYVGDSEVDVQTAKNAGLEMAGVTWGYRSREELLASGADKIVNEPGELLKIVVSPSV